MAAQRMPNVSLNYSFSEDSGCSDEDISVKKFTNSKDLKRVRCQTSVRERNSKVRRLQHLSSSCDENVPNRVNYIENDLENGDYKKRACNSKNAIMARENRLKKKLYLDSLQKQISSLKTANRQMKLTLGTQSSYITDLELELNYMRNVLANTKEISALLKVVNTSTGFPVSTSLKANNNNESLMERRQVSARRMPIAGKTAWPFEETCENPTGVSGEFIPTPPTSICSASPGYYDGGSPTSPLNLDVTSYFSDDDMPIALNDVGLSPYSVDNMLSSRPLLPLEEGEEENVDTFIDHNYSSKSSLETSDSNPDNVGVCLHISKKKVSLEFCSKCNHNAVTNWKSVTC